MFDNYSVSEIVKMLLPLILFQVGLAIYCTLLIWKKGVRNLNKPLWTVIVLFVNMIGPIAYLLLGRKNWTDDNDQ